MDLISDSFYENLNKLVSDLQLNQKTLLKTSNIKFESNSKFKNENFLMFY